ncbi:MAG TPA: HAD-IA family hydrolase [Planctomycetota bacterium]|nr:HAD-IA family hydrolase [Planctomycetota bacterium]
MAITALLLDAGGTLLCEKTSREAMYARAGTRRGLIVDSATMRGCMGEAHRVLPLRVDGHWRYSKPWFEAFIADVFVRQLGMAPTALPSLQEELFAAFADANNFRLTPGARELLVNARARGCRLALVSNWSPSMSAILDGLGVLEHFDAVLISALEQVEKPDRAIFERALARLNVSPGEALHAGNDPVQDVHGASECGIHALLFDPEGRHAALGLPGIRELAEIIPWIEKQR